MQLDEQMRMAIDRLNQSTDFQRFIELIRKMREEDAGAAITHVDPPLIYRCQGGVKLADRILSAVKEVKSPVGPKKRTRF